MTPGTDSIERLPLKANSTGRLLMVMTFALLALGVVMVHSAVASVVEPGQWYGRLDVRHTIFAALAAIMLAVAWRFDYRRLGGTRAIPVLPAVLLGLAVLCCALVYVPGVGYAVGGKFRWIRVGPPQYRIGFQPSELVKVALVVFLSAWLTRRAREMGSFTKTFLPAVALIGLCVGLVIREDFGTAALIAVSAGVTILLAGVPWYYLASLLPPAAGGFYWFVMCDAHRWGRITGMFDIWTNKNPSSYQPRMSLVAILTGGWFGKGPGRGTIKLGFLPEDTTDFIFAVYAEEWGFVGATLLIGIFIMWIWLVRRAVVRSRDRLGQVLAGSLGALVALQAALHIAVDLVALPPTGMSLPFISAGGTALIIMAAATAMIISVSAHRQDHAGLGD